MKNVLLYIPLTLSTLPLCVEGSHYGGSRAISTGVKSALFAIDQKQKSIFNTFGRNIKNENNGIIENINLSKTSLSAITDVVAHDDSNQVENQTSEHQMFIKGGGGFTIPKHNQKKFSSSRSSSTKRKKKNFLHPVSAYNRPLVFWENMICGAISRSVAQTIMHPANTMKTILQSRTQAGAERTTLFRLARPKNLKLLSRGAGAQFILSLPQGAVTFGVLELVRHQTAKLVAKTWGEIDEGRGIGPGLDFLSSAVSTICCSVVSTPQMMITDNIMAGTYPNMKRAILGIVEANGLKGFYTGWWPGVAGKIPSYGLTWVFFQQLKQLQLKIMKRDPTNIENSIMGCMASTATVCIMIPMDTIKVRLVTQANYPQLEPYKGIVDCSKRVLAEEGLIAFYRGLAPRLISVVPMIGIQFGVYEFMKKVVLAKNADLSEDYKEEMKDLEGIAMKVTAGDE